MQSASCKVDSSKKEQKWKSDLTNLDEEEEEILKPRITRGNKKKIITNAKTTEFSINNSEVEIYEKVVHINWLAQAASAKRRSLQKKSWNFWSSCSNAFVSNIAAAKCISQKITELKWIQMDKNQNYTWQILERVFVNSTIELQSVA